MGKKINELGNKYGRLLVIEEGPFQNKKKYWKCQCECGNVKMVWGYSLRNGQTKSCGCLQKEHASQLGKSKALDLKGKKFGMLTALEPTEERKHDGHSVVWKCLCDCGNTTYVGASPLVHGLIQSCGCLKSKGEQLIEKILQENNIKYIKQKTFSDLYFNNNSKNLAKFDFYIPYKNYLIEYDGEQHFRCTNNGWDSDKYFKDLQNRDKIKNEYCKNNNISLIRIPYTHFNNLCLEDLLLETSNFILSEE